MSESDYYDEVERLQDLTSNPEWDDEGALPILPDSWTAVRRIAGALDEIYGRAFIAPGGDGSIHLNYRLPNGSLLRLETGVTKP